MATIQHGAFLPSEERKRHKDAWPGHQIQNPGQNHEGLVPRSGAEGQTQGDEGQISRQTHGEDNGLEKAGSAGIDVPSSSLAEEERWK